MYLLIRTFNALGGKKGKKKTKKQTVSLNDFLSNKTPSSLGQAPPNWADATEDIDPSG